MNLIRFSHQIFPRRPSLYRHSMHEQLLFHFIALGRFLSLIYFFLPFIQNISFFTWASSRPSLLVFFLRLIIFFLLLSTCFFFVCEKIIFRQGKKITRKIFSWKNSKWKYIFEAMIALFLITAFLKKNIWEWKYFLRDNTRKGRHERKIKHLWWKMIN